MIRGIVSGAVWFGVFLVAHILRLHRDHVENAFDAIVRIFAACVVACAGTVVIADWRMVSTGAVFASVLYGFLVMGCLFILYMPFYFTLAASLSIQTLIVLAESPEKGLSLFDLRQLFASNAIVEGRLKIMAANGYLKAGGARSYYLTSKGRLVARVFGSIKELWRLGPGG